MKGLTPAEIDTVVGTHGHSDHIGNLNLFPHATVIVSYDISRGDTFISSRLGQGEPYKLHEWVEVLPTPGHTGSDVSVVVRNTSIGTVVVAGDLFECKDDLTDSTIWRDVSEQPEVQEKSRQRVLQIADHIVPGHGKMFRVSRPQDC
ncbi:hypothetical protein NP493_461g01006 [Ridgeia piscesae]|uniref:Metallo-beta-lactamase domain-containing protein 1 n=1 Tax=Ridgeia piscesae TaxID=27915 RepID=A0AAD9KZ55_RIDPI|nr:hypothetical protein NP493_461g01006 [Ridgeia piscesae]